MARRTITSGARIFRAGTGFLRREGDQYQKLAAFGARFLAAIAEYELEHPRAGGEPGYFLAPPSP